ncbi:MAG: hypothetical protein LQ346_005203 [Caloplaca aetnensis]|nr:MAG: hypothetical protein LQ346_005203 [Caloplaca aetnensis]
MPQRVGTSQIFSKARILDAEFLPNWLYHFPDYIRDQALNPNIENEIVHINNKTGALNRAAQKWNKSKWFDGDFDVGLEFRLWPYVADVGRKNTVQSYRTGSYIAVDFFFRASRLYNRLLKPRTFEQGKKRLVELPSHNLDVALICWLTVPPEEKPFFEDFVNRHSLSECFFGERVDWRGNIWESEFHLGFFQMLPNQHGDGYPSHVDDSLDLRRIQEIPSLQETSGNRKLGLVGGSLRFVGDLRDRLWTCHFYSSISREGYTGILNKLDRFSYEEGNREELYSDAIGQRRILELSYILGIFKEMEESSEGIIEVIQDELGVSEAQNVQNQSYEFIRDYSQVHLTTGEILRNVLRQFSTALGVIGDWEGREESRGIQSRWSDKDEKRYGEKLKDLTRKCKVSIQHLRTQKTRLEEQRLLAEQRHNNLLTYLQLQDARKSSQSAEDVRLFTYVTIVFLPLSFAASLFSMQGAPSGNTISIMVQTTVIGLAITILVLANMKTLDRNWSYRVSTFGESTRKRMLEAGNEFWKGRAQELHTAAQLRASKPESLKHLPAESKWYYFSFWIWYTLGRPRYRVIDGLDAWRNRKNRPHNYLPLKILSLVLMAPVSLLVFATHFLLFNLADMLALLRSTMGRLWAKLRELWQLLRHEKGPSNIGSDDVEEVRSTQTETPTKQDPRWLQTPPRPLQARLHRQLHPLPSGTSNESEPRTSDDNREGLDLVRDGNVPSDDDEMELAIEENASPASDIGAESESQRPRIIQQGPKDDAEEVKQRRWIKLFKKKKRSESKV